MLFYSRENESSWETNLVYFDFLVLFVVLQERSKIISKNMVITLPWWLLTIASDFALSRKWESVESNMAEEKTN